MNTLALWEHALTHLRATDENPDGTLALWRSQTPDRATDPMLLEEYGWVVLCCGLTPHVLLKRWDRFGEAFRGWRPDDVASHPADVRIAALEVMKTPKKIQVIQEFADDLAREPGRMARLAAKPDKEALAWFSTLPYVGANNRYHLARNLGWDVVVKSGPVPRLAAYLETTAEDLCEQVAEETGERLRTVDLVLWNWGHQVGDAHMKEMASIFRLMPPRSGG